MDAIDLSDYVSGGYFVAKPIQREPWMSKELLPQTIISVSSCRNNSKVLVYWGWDIEKHHNAVVNLGIPSSKISDFQEWSTSDKVGYTSTFYTLGAAREFICTFITDDSSWSIFGVGLPKQMANKFLIDNPRSSFDPRTQTWQKEILGVNLALSQHKALDPNGTILGFEIISYSYFDMNCSWLCNGIDRDMFKLFNIRPNQYGLIDSYAEAKQVYEWIAEDELQGTRSEPEPYYPWLIVQYPIT